MAFMLRHNKLNLMKIFIEWKLLSALEPQAEKCLKWNILVWHTMSGIIRIIIFQQLVLLPLGEHEFAVSMMI